MIPYLKFFWFSISGTILAIVLSIYYLGPAALIPLIILMVIEITFSFDNAVVNAKILRKMSPFWQKLFLSVGIIIAIFGMRLVFPILIVAVTADLPWRTVIDLALNNPTEYAERLEIAHPTITAFGGAFLLMLALHFFMDKSKAHNWFNSLEKFLLKISAHWMPTVITASVILLIAALPMNEHPRDTIQAGFIGLFTYLAIHGISIAIEKTTKKTSQLKHYTGWAAFAMFMYLEVLDASFSLDGVLGAFAITSDVILIVAGLGIGAIWVRSLTVYMVRKGTLDMYRFLEHGAHYAIAVLAAAMLFSAIFELSEAITGAIGLGFIVASIIASNKVKHLTSTVPVNKHITPPVK